MSATAKNPNTVMPQPIPMASSIWAMKSGKAAASSDLRSVVAATALAAYFGNVSSR